MRQKYSIYFFILEVAGNGIVYFEFLIHPTQGFIEWLNVVTWQTAIWFLSSFCNSPTPFPGADYTQKIQKRVAGTFETISHRYFLFYWEFFKKDTKVLGPFGQPLNQPVLSSKNRVDRVYRSFFHPVNFRPNQASFGRNLISVFISVRTEHTRRLSSSPCLTVSHIT